MRTSKYPLFTLKDKKINKESLVNDLMIKSGLIRKLSSGLYTWMPIGFKIIKKIIKLISKEMSKINAFEFFMPILQPKNILEKENKINNLNSELFICKSRNKQDFILSPTNEDIITNIIKKEIKSYKQLPIILFQINTKFRDELRCKSGVVRTKEFIMKDAYSFHEDKISLKKTYNTILIAYKNIFKKLKINFFITKANSKSIGGSISHEFQSISNFGEDNILICNKSKKSVNPEILNNIKKKTNNYFFNIKKKIKLIDLDINNLSINRNNKYINNLIKVIIVRSNRKYINSDFLALVIKFTDEISKFKVNKLKQIHKPLIFANNEDIYKITKTSSIFIGLINLKIPIIIDYEVSIMNNFIMGANIDKKFFCNVNWYRDIKIPIIKDIKKMKDNDISPFHNNCKLKIKKSVEIAHIFQLDDKYSSKLNFNIKNKDKIKKNIFMGCYGIGISRVLASIIEQNNINNKINLPYSISSFEVALVPINKINVLKYLEKIYNNLLENNIDVLLEDREENIEIILNDLELIGIPNIFILNEKNNKKGLIELKEKNRKNKLFIKIENILNFLIYKRKKNI